LPASSFAIDGKIPGSPQVEPEKEHKAEPAPEAD